MWQTHLRLALLLVAAVPKKALQCLLQDGTAMLWDLAEGKRLYNLDAGEIIYALCFSPNRYWLCAATTNVIKVRQRLIRCFWSNTHAAHPCRPSRKHA